MNLNRINDYPGTGTNANTEAPWSSAPFKTYAISILKILVGFIMFCYITTTNYLNTLTIDVDKDYPVGDAILNALSKQNKNPYCSGLVGCEYINNVTSDSSKFTSMARWFQITQESSYELGGKLLHKYFEVSKMVIGKDTQNGSSYEIPHTGLIAFIRWIIFGLFTKLSIVVMILLLYGMWIPGWIGGLLAFWPLTKTIQSVALKLICQFWLLIGSFVLMCVIGWVSVFPVIYEFIYLFYLFFIKQLTGDSTKVGDEFMSRMKYLIIVFVIVALIVAAIQLPPQAAGAMTVIVVLMSAISYKLSNKDEPSKTD